MQTKREVIHTLVARNKKANTNLEKSVILDQTVALLQYHRKHAIRVLANPYCTSTNE
jgi:hypothetical protein